MKRIAVILLATLLAVRAHAGTSNDGGSINPAAAGAAEAPAADPGVSPEMIDLLADAVIAKLRAKPELLLDIIQRYEEKAPKPSFAMIRADDPVSGPPDADVTLVQFFDPGCITCRTAATAVDQAAAADGRVRVVTKEFPTSPEGVTMSINALGAKDYAAAHAGVLVGLMPPAPDAPAVAKASSAIAANRNTAARYNVRVVPTMFIVGDGSATRIEGQLTAPQLIEKIKLVRFKTMPASKK